MRWLGVLLAVAVLSVAGVGCGGGDESASGDTTTTETTAEETTTDETTADETTTEETTTDLSGVLADEDCLALVAAGASLAQAFGSAGGLTDETSASLEELVDKVPAEIEADVRVLAEAYADYAAELQDIGIEAGQTPSAAQLQQLQQALASFDQQAVAQASERLNTWATENCSTG